MARGVRRTAQQKLPEKVKWATQVPILVIPSAGHSRLAEGTEIAVGPKARRQEVERRTPTNSRRENVVRLRYAPCCDEHKAQITVDSLVSPAQLIGMCNRFSQHYGHGALRPGDARVEWDPCNEKIACQDCLEAAREEADA